MSMVARLAIGPQVYHHRDVPGAVPAMRAAFGAVLLSLTALPAVAGPIPVNVPGIGTIGDIDVSKSGNAIIGGFNVTKKNADGTTKTLAQLEKLLAEDHLNWFQKVTDKTPVTPTFPAKFIDPQKGGQGRLWADNRPWYLNEEPIPNPLPPPRTRAFPAFQLSNAITNGGKKLNYQDQPNIKANFSSFLVSDYDNTTWGAGGPRTYSVLGGFTWNTQGGAPTNPVATAAADFTQDFRDEIQSQFGWREAAAPDAKLSNAQNPLWQARETASANALIIVQPTSGGVKIDNANGSRVQYSRTVPSGATSVVFDIPGTIDGKKVSDATQWTKARSDPGALSFAAFDSGGDMLPSFSAWLASKGLFGSNTLYMPDFSPDLTSGLDAIFYGVDTATLLDAGKDFVDTQNFGDALSTGQLLADLPGYVFSSTPLDYVPGMGWTGTPLDPGTMLDYSAFHQVDDVPEPGTLALLSVALLALGMARARSRAGPAHAGAFTPAPPGCT